MKVALVRYTPEQWYGIAEESHRAVFKAERNPWLDRINYALLTVLGGEAIGFVTVRENDAESAYLQFGGSLDGHRGITAVRAVQAIFAELRNRYKRCLAYVRNDNINTLHLLMKQGMRVVGTRYSQGGLYLELALEFTDVAEDKRLPEASKSTEDASQTKKPLALYGQERNLACSL